MATAYSEGVYIYIGMEHVFCYMCLPTIFVRKYKVKKLVTDLGWNAVEGSLLTDDAIRREVPPLTHYFDPMHVFFVQGQFSRHVGLLLKALKKMGWTPDSIAEACTNDSIRHRSSTRKVARAQFARELGDAYFTEGGIWKVSASSQLGAAPLLHFLIRFVVFPTITCPDLKKELQAFLLLGSVLSLWVQIKFTPYGEAVRKHAESAEALRNHAEALARRFQSGINAYITAFEEVYGLEKMRPKTHYMLHLVQQYRDHCRMLDAFILERKHRAAKAKIEHLSGKAHGSVVSVLYSLWSLQVSEIREAQPFAFSCDGRRLDSGHCKIELGQVVWFPLHRKAGFGGRNLAGKANCLDCGQSFRGSQDRAWVFRVCRTTAKNASLSAAAPLLAAALLDVGREFFDDPVLTLQWSPQRAVC